MGKTVNAAYDQDRFAEVNNDGADEAATLGTTNADFSKAFDTTFRVRFTIQQTATAATGQLSITPTLFYSYNGGAYLEVGNPADTDAPVRVVNDGNVTDNGTTTLRLGSGDTEVTGRFEDTAPGATAVTFSDPSTGEATEYEWALQIYSGYAGLANSDTIALRVYDNATSLDTYANTPTVTAIVASTEVDVDGLLGQVRAVGFAPTATIEIERTADALLGQVNVETAPTGPDVDWQYQITPPDPWQGEINFQGFIPTVDAGGEVIFNATGLLGQVNVQGFAASVVTFNEIPVTGLLGQVNIEGFAGTLEAVNELQVTSLLGQVNVEGFAATATITYEPTYFHALGQVNLEGFEPTVSVTYEPTYFSLLGEVNAQGFIPTITLVYEPTVGTSLGEVSFEGFIATIGRESDGGVNSLLGTVNAEGFAPSVGIERLVSGSVGQVNVEGFAGVASALSGYNASPALGIVNADGSIATVAVTRPAVAAEPEVEDRGAGSGRYDDQLIQLQEEDKIILDMIKDFMARVA